MALYSTQQFHRAYVESGYETYRLDLDPVTEEIEHNKFRSINLGLPIVTNKASEVRDQEFLDRSYATLKPLVDAEYLNLKTRRFGHIQYWT